MQNLQPRSEVVPRRRPILVCFSGIDGAGKSTQIEILSTQLSDAGLRVRRLAFWDNIAVLRSLRQYSSHAIFKSEKGVGSPDRPVNRRDKNVQSWYMTVFRCFLYLLDTFQLSVLVGKARHLDTDVVIFDRYLYDELANLPLNRRLVCGYVRLLLNFVPRPDVACLLDADPGQARQRKPEYPLEFICSNRASYLALSKMVGEMTVVEPAPASEVACQVREAVWKKLSSGQGPAISPAKVPSISELTRR